MKTVYESEFRKMMNELKVVDNYLDNYCLKCKKITCNGCRIAKKLGIK